MSDASRPDAPDAVAPDAVARLAAFATAGAFQLTQEMAGRVAAEVPGADGALLAEETLALVSVVTARAVEASAPAMSAVADTLRALPDLVRDYFVGAAVLADPDNAGPRVHAAGLDRERVARKAAFYEAHFPAGQFPGPTALAEKLPLWLGRVSGPGLPEPPDARVARMDLAADVLVHLRLVRSFVRQPATAAAPPPTTAPA